MLSSTAATLRPRVDTLAWMALPLLPTLLAYNVPPSPTLLNQCLSIGLWGVCLAGLARSGAPHDTHATSALQLACLAIAIGVGWAVGGGALPSPSST